MDYNDIIEIAKKGTFIAGSYIETMMILQESELPKSKIGLDVNLRRQEATQFYCGSWNDKEEKWKEYVDEGSTKIMRTGMRKFDKWIKEKLINKYGYIPKTWELEGEEI